MTYSLLSRGLQYIPRSKVLKCPQSSNFQSVEKHVGCRSLITEIYAYTYSYSYWTFKIQRLVDLVKFEPKYIENQIDGPQIKSSSAHKLAEYIRKKYNFNVKCINSIRRQFLNHIVEYLSKFNQSSTKPKFAVNNCRNENT